MVSGEEGVRTADGEGASSEAKCSSEGGGEAVVCGSCW